MQKSTYLLLLMVSMFFMFACTNSVTNRYKINSDWKFKLLEEAEINEEEFSKKSYDDTSWEDVSLPHTAHIEPLLVNNQWQGTCWYRKAFEIPSAMQNKQVVIELEAAMNHSKIWINGHKVSIHQGGYLPVVLDISEFVVFGQKNIMAVRLNNTDNAITGPKPMHKLDFNMYGGLYRNAWISYKEKIHISHPVIAQKTAGGGVFITTSQVSKKQSLVHVKSHIVNTEEYDIKVQVVNTILWNNQVVKKHESSIILLEAGSSIDPVGDIKLNNPRLWSPSHPNLYHMETKVLVDGSEVDKQTDRFGIREFTFIDNDLYVNGEKTFLRGVNRHQEYPFIGYALSDNAQYRDAKKIKDAGFDYVRLSHYPQSPAFMDACDELGLIVIDAILGWQYYLDNDDFREYCYRSAKELIYRDRNHPCVLAWEVSLNETQMPIFFMEKLHDIVHREFPSETTYSCGWKDDVYDIYLQARQHRIMHPHHLKDKPYVVSEYGDWEYYSSNAGLNQHKLDKQLRYETSSRQFRRYGEKRLMQQSKNVQEAHNDNFNTPAFADGYWVMYDYNRGYHDDIEASGIMDIFRLPKFAYYFYQSQQSPEQNTVLNIASYWNKESCLDVKVYSNCDNVSLYLNDELIADQQPDGDSVSNHLSHPPFTFKVPSFVPGTLKAIGKINGQVVKETIVNTPGQAVALKVWLDESGKQAEAACNDVLFLYIAAVDNNGTIIPDFDGLIELEHNLEIEVMNVGEIKAEAGIATALIKIGNKAKSVNVKASSEGLKSNQLTFEVLRNN
ncbi:glycoside hydrolase family 2 TIM barrel-domain containing protein [Labilibacter marinus]|uniref:glycoside hydrolase family 2 TIM barrel-domain containing protein n=1 Tax=Labilibacter marinus TaxID=1477105 RepID=UPI00082E2F9D|nr:glycoside hydrolase family 2 TIM barrel-domain containing protein [Labilibacter marinus]